MRALRSLMMLAFVAPLLPIPASAQEPAPDTAEAKQATKGLPLEPTRTLEFTAREGSWMSVDVSPDGETLVFDHLGDLFTLPIAGGTATRLMGGIAFEAMPRFSPDGERVVFVSDRSGGHNLWTVTLDGSDTTQVTKGNDNLYTSPEWTPDGRWLVASRTYSPLGGEAKLWLFHAEGGSGTALVKEPEDLKMLGAAFGDEERWIWYAERDGDWQYDAALPEYQLALYDRDTGRRTRMSSRYGSAFRPALSPDGRWLVYATRHEDETGIRIRDLESGEERWLAYPVQHDDQESRATLDVYPGYSFTPDSRAIVVTYGGKLWRVPVDGSAPSEIPFQVDASVPLGPRLEFEYPIVDSATFIVRQIEDAVPSPDGTRLAFTALDRLYIMDWPSGTPRRVTDGANGGEYHPAWSADGRWLAYVTWSDRTGGHLWKVRPAGGAPVRLTTTPAYYTGPAWSPTGERLALTRAPARARQEGGFGGGPTELVWVPADGGAATLIAPAGGRGGLHFTEDPDRIYAYSGGEGLVSFRWDGTDEKEHVRVTGFTRQGASQPRPASRIVKAPRGDLALAEVEGHVYMVTVPWVGGETPRISVTNPENAAFPARKLTDVGGQFPAWEADGRTVHWSIGNAHVVYDLDAAEAFEDSVEAARPDTAGAPADTASSKEEDAPEYKPVEVRIQIPSERDIPRGAAVLRGARAITMRGDEVIEDADIVIRDNRIAAVGPRGSVSVPEGAEVIDVRGRTIVPGFIDTHAHLRPDFGVHTEQPWEYLANLAYGVTTTRDPQTGSTDVLTYSDRVRAGDIVGPRVYSTGPGVFGSYQGEAIEDLDHARALLRRYSEYWGTKYFKMYLAGNRQQRQWLIMAARELELLPTTEAGLDIMLDLTHAMDGYPGVEHNLPVYPLYDDVVRLFAESGTVNTPTLVVSFGGPRGESFWYTTTNVHGNEKLRRFTPHEEIDENARRRGSPGVGWALPEEYVFDDHARFLADVMDAGGCAGVGSHGQLQGLAYHWELWMVQSGGMSEHQALRAATLCGARAIGMAGDLGSIEAGKLADLVILERDPLEDLRNTEAIDFVMKNGRLYEGDTLDEVWPRRRALPGRVWRAAEPEVAAGIRP